MRLYHLIATIAICIASCSVPEGPSDSDRAGDPLTILAVYGDSLFAGEQLILKVDRPNLRPSNIRLFVHMITMQIDSAVDSLIYITVAPTSSGKIRLYDGEELAQGEFHITIFNSPFAENVFKSFSVEALEGKVGDTITFRLFKDDVDEATINPRISGVPMQFVGKHGKMLSYRIMPGSTDGWLEVHIGGRRSRYAEFNIRSEEEIFLELGTISIVEVVVGDLMMSLTRTDSAGIDSVLDISTVQCMMIPPERGMVLLKPIQITRGDSIRVVYDYVNGGTTRSLRMALHYDPVKRLLSGSITTCSSENWVGYPSLRTLGLKFRDLPVGTDMRSHTMFIACREAVTEGLVSLYYREEIPSRKEVYTVTNVNIAGSDCPWFSIMINE